MLQGLKYHVLEAMEMVCGLVDRLPNWTYPFIGRFLGCPSGIAQWSIVLDERWKTGYWYGPKE